MFRITFNSIFRQTKLRNRNLVLFTRQFSQQIRQRSHNSFILTSIAGLSGYLLFTQNIPIAQCAVKLISIKKHEIIREDLPFFTTEELSLHNNKYIIKNPGVDTFDIVGNAWEIERENGIWISYGVGIYDISKLIDENRVPDESILLAAGTALEPFWNDKKLNEKQEILDTLEECRIGNLKK